MANGSFRAIFFDFGGVMTDSPFDNFARYEREHGLPTDFIRSVNATNPDHNAWARIERQDITTDEFDHEFATESEALGHRIPGRAVLDMLRADLRPEMEQILDDVIAAGFITACLTNNVASNDMGIHANPVMTKFDYVIESSKVGVRKPEPRFYEIACETAGVEPSECIFLDDLGINLKPAKAMGMTTIKVVGGAQAVSELTMILGW